MSRTQFGVAISGVRQRARWYAWLWLPMLMWAIFAGGVAEAGTIFVSNGVNATVIGYDFTGAVVRTLPVAKLTNPEGLVLDSSGNLYVAEDGGGDIRKFAPNDSSTVLGAGFGHFDGLALDASGNLFATIADNGNVYKFDTSGTRTTFASAPVTQLAGLAFDGGGNLYATSPQSNQIFKFTSAGTRTVFAAGIDNPQGLAFDSSGNLYTVGFFSGLVTKITPGGNQSTYASGLSGGIGLAFDDNNILYATAQPGNHSVFKIQPNGTMTTFVSNLGGTANFIAISVPEPSSIILLAVGSVFSIALFRRRVARMSLR